jgi:hypothetical protein
MTKFEVQMTQQDFIEEIQIKSIKERMPLLVGIICDHKQSMLMVNKNSNPLAAVEVMYSSSHFAIYEIHCATDGWTI